MNSSQFVNRLKGPITDLGSPSATPMRQPPAKRSDPTARAVGLRRSLSFVGPAQGMGGVVGPVRPEGWGVVGPVRPPPRGVGGGGWLKSGAGF